MQLDYGLIQILYEMFGETAESLASQFGTSTAMMKVIIREKGFKRLPAAEGAQDWTDNKVVDEALLDDVNLKQSVLHAIKEKVLSPHIIRTEVALLNKINTILTNINDTEASAATRLKAIADVFMVLREKSAPTREQAGGGPGGLNLQINIMGKVPDDYETSEHQQVKITEQSRGCLALS